jgi:hypothetical protein
VEEEQTKHVAEVAKLQKQIDALDNQIIRMQMTAVKATGSSPNPATRSKSSPLNVSLIEREAAEGSENLNEVSSSSALSPSGLMHQQKQQQSRQQQQQRQFQRLSSVSRTPTTIMPLDQLLSSPNEDNEDSGEFKDSLDRRKRSSWVSQALI